ncbi:MAG: site-specific DNA-methyltransferase [Thaumarchaeota archaeon]|nr:site-specific DNA-methyltransferase [Nitrososphaerota archaeon]
MRHVLDPFLGSGTTLIAAHMLKRKGVGVEIDSKYCEIAKQRLTNEAHIYNKTLVEARTSKRD